MAEIKSKYGYSIGQIVETKVVLTDESGKKILAGTKLRIVAIAPKVRILPKDDYHDNLAYFYNAVVKDQLNDYSNRIRANFCTIRKVRNK